METVLIGSDFLKFISFEDEVSVLGSVLGVNFRDFVLAFKVLLLSFCWYLDFKFSSFGISSLESNFAKDLEELLIQLLDLMELPKFVNVNQDIEMTSIGTKMKNRFSIFI